MRVGIAAGFTMFHFNLKNPSDATTVGYRWTIPLGDIYQIIVQEKKLIIFYYIIDSGHLCKTFIE